MFKKVLERNNQRGNPILVKVAFSLFFILFYFLFSFSLPFVSADLTGTIPNLTTSGNILSYKSFQVTPMLNLSMNLTNFDWIINQDTKEFYPRNNIAFPGGKIPEFVYLVNQLETPQVCSGNQYYQSCSKDVLDFTTFEEKNNITNKTITPINRDIELNLWKRIQYFFLDIFGKAPPLTEETIGYLVQYAGIIRNLDPAFTIVNYSTGSGFFNQTNATGFGVSIEPILNATTGYKYTTGNYSNFVFYNSTYTYWITRFGIADTYTNRSGIVKPSGINISDPNLVAYWGLDEAVQSTTFVDALGLHNANCSATTCPNVTHGLSSNAESFDGSNDYLEAGQINLTTNYTLSAWIKRTSTANYNAIIAKRDRPGATDSLDYWFAIESGADGSNLALLWTTGGTGQYQGIATTKAIPDSNWHHVLAINPNDGVGFPQIYIDGVNQTYTIRNGAGKGIADVTNALTLIGQDNMELTDYFPGSIDEVLIYNKSLTPSEVNSIYKAGLSQHSNTNITLYTRSATSYNTSDGSLVAMLGLNNDSSIGENSTFFADSSIRKANGSCVGTTCPTFTNNGTVGNAYYFDGSDDKINNTYIDMPIRTISMWVYYYGTPSNYAGLFTDAYNGLRAWHESNVLNAYVPCECTGANCFSAANYVLLNQWMFITAVTNGSNVVFYRNGYYHSKSATCTGYFGNNTNNGADMRWVIGRNEADGVSFKGMIDEVRIYNRSLNSSEVLNLYEFGNYHITNWTDWTKDGFVLDNVQNTSVTKNNFFQFKAELSSNDTISSPYILNHTVQAWNPPPDSTFPSNIRNYQQPADISSTNVIGNGLNISNNITDNIELDNNTIQLFYKTNHTLEQDNSYFINGTAIRGSNPFGYFNLSFNTTFTTGSSYYWWLEETSVYPATYNLDEIGDVRNTYHGTENLTNNNEYLKIEFQNLTQEKTLLFEVMANTSGTGSLRAYYCNSSYTTGNPATNNYCAQFGTLLATKIYNHTHSTLSSHNFISTSINQTTKQINGIYVSNTSYIILRGVTGSTWTIGMVAKTSRTGAMALSTNTGTSYTNKVYTIDAHIHQFSDNDTFYHYVCANDTANNQNCTSPQADLMSVGGLLPTGLVITSPQNISYEKSPTFNISYTEPYSPNGYPIVLINISLYNIDLSYNQSVLTNNTGNLNYSWDVSSVTEGSYILRIQYCDNYSQCKIANSPQFTLMEDMTPPNSFINLFRRGLTWLEINWTIVDTSPTSAKNISLIDTATNLVWYSILAPTSPYKFLGLYHNHEYRVILNVNDSYGNINSTNMTATTSNTYLVGSGTSEDPYNIYNWIDLNNTRLDLGANYSLRNSLSLGDIDYIGVGNDFTPIGTNAAHFKGSFNGNGFTISDLKINKLALAGVGLFGYLDGNVSDLGLVNVNIRGDAYTGGIAGYSKGLIYNCYTTGTVYSDSFETGGLVGELDGVINNSYSTATVQGTSSDVGGLVGWADDDAAVFNSYAKVSSVLAGGDYAGGLIGDTYKSEVSNCYTIINGSVEGDDSVGSLIGYVDTSTITNSYSIMERSGEIVGTGDAGLIGSESGSTITGTYLLIRNKYYGEILYNDSLGDGNINGNIYVDPSLAYITNDGYSQPATVTLKRLPTNYINPSIKRNGVTCSDCENFTSLNAGTVIFNISQFGSYTIGNNVLFPLNETCAAGYAMNGHYSNGSIRCEFNEVDPYWTLNWTNMKQTCPTNYSVNGFWDNGTIKCNYINWSSGATTTIATIQTCKYKKLAYYNPKLSWLKKGGCL